MAFQLDNSNSTYFKLYANCILVKGYNQSVIIELSKNLFSFISNELYDVLIKSKSKNISQLKEHYQNLFDTEIDSFFLQLISRGLGFYTRDLFNYPEIDLSWYSPFKITNIIIDISGQQFPKIDVLNNHNLKTDCLSLIIENFNKEVKAEIKTIIKILNYQSIQLFFYKEIDIDEIEQLITDFPYLTHVYILNCKKNEIRVISDIVVIYSVTGTLFNNSQQLDTQNKFVVNINYFLESQEYNTYFNRKLYIGSDGEIKNFPESLTNFGNINQLKKADDVLDIIGSKKFQEYWSVNKSLIDICKQCEFRLMCIDNRLPKKRNLNEWFMETECNYNPYISKWKGEEGYKTLRECGIIADNKSFKINKKKLNLIRKEL